MHKPSRHNGRFFYAVMIAFFLYCLRQPAAAYPAECLYDSVFIKIRADYTAEITFTQKYKFNHAQASEYSVIKIPVNRYIDFKLIGVKTMLPDGRELSLKNRDIEMVSDFTPQYYPDSKSVILYIPAARVKAEAYVSYMLTYKSLLYLPRFFRQRDVPTGNSFLKVESEIPYAYYASDSFTRATDINSNLILFVGNIPPSHVEPHMPPPSDFQIIVRPDSVVYWGNKYGFASWHDVADFYNQLSAGDNEMKPDSQITRIADSLVAGATTRSDSLKALLDYMLENIRYISMDIGRGEFKPLKPIEVLEKKYGDCKDQSELLCALCRAVGFAADPALMSTRNNPDVLISLPWPGFFNHVITAVDTGNGYRFLDASQATCCFGNLPFNLRNRRALVCGNSPFLEFTLTSPYVKENKITINSSYVIGSEDNMAVSIKMQLLRDPAYMFYSADEQQVLSNVLYAFFGDELKGRFSSSFKINHNQPDFIEVTGSLLEKPQSSPGGKRLLVNIMSPFSKILKKYFPATGRVNPYVFDFTFNISEETDISVPPKFSPDIDSLSLAFNERGIKADIDSRCDTTSVSFNKSFSLFEYTIDADRYNKFADFLLKASQASYNSVEIISTDE